MSTTINVIASKKVPLSEVKVGEFFIGNGRLYQRIAGGHSNTPLRSGPSTSLHWQWLNVKEGQVYHGISVDTVELVDITIEAKVK